LTSLLRDYGIVPYEAPIALKSVSEDVFDGYRVELVAGDQSGTASVRQIDGHWFIAPSPVSDAQYHAVKAAALAFFDEHFAPDMAEWGASPAEIAAARAATRPTHAFFPGEEDPWGYTN